MKGINNQLVTTLERTQLDVQIGDKTISAEFEIVHSAFPIPNDGILGRPFMIKNEIIMNYQTIKVIIPNESEIVLEPRTETLIEVNASHRTENETILIVNQEINSVMCCNAVTRVKYQKALVFFINPTENGIQIKVPDLKELVYEEFREASLHVLQSEIQEENHADTKRIKQLKVAQRTNHLNSEEKDSLETICKEYPGVFFLEGNKITATTAAAHEIRLSEIVTPIHEKPYRLPQSHRQEILEQMENLKREGVIAPSESPWNAPVLVVPKKPNVNVNVKYRVCVDFRRLNDVTIGDAFPLPNIVDILDQLGRSN